MAGLLNIDKTTFYRKIKDQDIKPINEGNENCEFCKRTREKGLDNNEDEDDGSVITNHIKEILKNACNGHKVNEMAQVLEVNEITLRKYILRSNIKFTNNDPLKCYFCVPVDSQNRKATWRNMQPIIDLIKKLAFREKKTDVAILSRIAVSMLYHSNRKASQIFQQLGEDADSSNLKFTLPMKQAIQLKTKIKLTVKQYKMMRNCLSDYLSLPGYANLSKESRKLMPILEDPYDFMMNGEIV